MQPLQTLVKRNIRLSNYPALMKSSKDGLASWVHLRYVSNKGSIEYIKLEPENELDPIEEEMQSSAK